MCDTAVLSQRNIIAIFNKTKEKNTKGGNIEDSRRCGRKHILSIVQTLDRAEETNKFAKEEKLFVRIPDGDIISWDANWNTTEILISCEIGIGTAVITIAEVILKDMPVSLHLL